MMEVLYLFLSLFYFMGVQPSTPQSVPTQTTLASYYKHGKVTASGQPFNPNGLTAAHKTLPFGTRVRVTNLSNGKSVVVTINDRGPFVAGRAIDLAYGAAKRIGMIQKGVVKVRYQVVR